MRYKTTRPGDPTRTNTCISSAEGSAAFDALPVVLRNMNPWTGGREGEVERLRLAYYRVKLCVLHPSNVECPQSKGRGRVQVPHRMMRGADGDGIKGGPPCGVGGPGEKGSP